MAHAHTHPKRAGEEDGVSMSVEGGNAEWAVQKTRQLFFDKTQGSGDGYAAEAPAVEKGLWRWRSGYFEAAGEVGDKRARLRCVEKVRLINEANKIDDWKRRVPPPAAGTWRHATTKKIKTRRDTVLSCTIHAHTVF